MGGFVQDFVFNKMLPLIVDGAERQARREYLQAQERTSSPTDTPVDALVDTPEDPQLAVREQAAYEAGKRFERQQLKRAAYRQQLSRENPMMMWTPGALTDDYVDRQILLREGTSTPQLVQRSEVWDLPSEARRARGYYTNAEREMAASMNDIRSNTVFGNIMPNFGRMAAYYNPEAEQQAFTITSYYLPSALQAADIFVPSQIAPAVATGIREGIAAGTNLVDKALKASVMTGKSVLPLAKNPKVILSTISTNTPFIAAAMDNSENSNILNYLLMAGAGVGGALGFNKLRKYYKSLKETPEKAVAALNPSYKYQPDRRLFTIEKPRHWESRQRAKSQDKYWNDLGDEWTKTLSESNPAQAQEKFIRDRQLVIDKDLNPLKDNNISFTPKFPIKEVPVKKGSKTTKLVDAEGNEIRYLTPEEAKEYIASKGNLNGVGKPSIAEGIYRGPTRQQINWATARNAGRIGLGAAVLGGLGYGFFGRSGSDNTSASDSTSVDNKSGQVDSIPKWSYRGYFPGNSNYSPGIIYNNGLKDTLMTVEPQDTSMIKAMMLEQYGHL